MHFNQQQQHQLLQLLPLLAAPALGAPAPAEQSLVKRCGSGPSGGLVASISAAFLGGGCGGFDGAAIVQAGVEFGLSIAQSSWCGIPVCQQVAAQTSLDVNVWVAATAQVPVGYCNTAPTVPEGGTETSPTQPSPVSSPPAEHPSPPPEQPSPAPEHPTSPEQPPTGGPGKPGKGGHGGWGGSWGGSGHHGGKKEGKKVKVEKGDAAKLFGCDESQVHKVKVPKNSCGGSECTCWKKKDVPKCTGCEVVAD